MKFGYQLPV